MEPSLRKKIAMLHQPSKVIYPFLSQTPINGVSDTEKGKTEDETCKKTPQNQCRRHQPPSSGISRALAPCFIVKLAGIIMAFLCVFWAMPEKSMAAGTMQSRVRVIHATSGNAHIDPALKDLAQELQSVFKYTAYRLINAKSLNLTVNRDGTVPLPGGRNLKLLYKGMQNGRIQLTIRILKENRQIFTTNVLLRNHGSITIGGPRFKQGYLLFNISGNAG